MRIFVPDGIWPLMSYRGSFDCLMLELALVQELVPVLELELELLQQLVTK